DELAFAIGSLSHYLGDVYGHSEAVNPSVGQTFPKLASKYGPVITFEQASIAHGRVEMGFDMAQIGLNRFAPRAHRRNIGFRVARELLNRAFHETYGLRVRDVVGRERPALKSYRYSVRRLLPKFLEVEVLINHKRFSQEKDDDARREYLEKVAHTEY